MNNTPQTLTDFIQYLNRHNYTPSTIGALAKSAHFSSVIFGDISGWEEISNY